MTRKLEMREERGAYAFVAVSDIMARTLGTHSLHASTVSYTG
jgi:hypothetical protein